MQCSLPRVLRFGKCGLLSTTRLPAHRSATSLSPRLPNAAIRGVTARDTNYCLLHRWWCERQLLVSARMGVLLDPGRRRSAVVLSLLSERGRTCIMLVDSSYVLLSRLQSWSYSGHTFPT